MKGYTARKETDFIAVHCSATKPSVNWDEADIRASHLAKGWIDAGYNIVIPRWGTIQIARPLDFQGAHVEGYNSRALGICLIGGVDEQGRPDPNYTPIQMDDLLLSLRFAKRYAPHARIQGHRDFPGVKKDCPCFDVREWLGRVAPELL